MNMFIQNYYLILLLFPNNKHKLLQKLNQRQRPKGIE